MALTTIDNRKPLNCEFSYNVCRGCLFVSPVEFSPIDDRILSSFTELSGINVSKDSRLPHRLCVDCSRSIKQTIRFKNKCLHSNRILTELLQTSLTFGGQFDLNDLRKERRKILNDNPLTLSKTLTVDCLDKSTRSPIDQPKTFTNIIKSSDNNYPDPFADLDLKEDEPLSLIGQRGKNIPNNFITYNYDGDWFFDHINSTCPESIYSEISDKLFVIDSSILDDELPKTVNCSNSNSNFNDQDTWKGETSVKKEVGNSLYVEVSKADDDDIEFHEDNDDDDDFDPGSLSPSVKEEYSDYDDNKQSLKVKKRKKRKTHKKSVSTLDDDAEDELNLSSIKRQSEPTSVKRKRSTVDRYESSKEKSELKLEKKKSKSKKDPNKKKGPPKRIVEKTGLQIYHFDESCVNVLKLTTEQQIQDLEDAKKTKQYADAPYKCSLCAKWFTYEVSWQAHMLRHEESAGKYLCLICQQRYTSPRSLRCHTLIHQERLECKQCLKVLCGRSHMAKHVAKHKGITQTFECDVCGSTSTSKSNHKRHMRMHTSEPKRFKCPYCPKVYTHCTTRNDHTARAHTGQKNFSCEVCSMAFVNKTALKAHSIRHSEKKEFYCVECDKSFKTRSSLAAHLNVSVKHANPAFLKFKCDQCEKRYETARRLKLHVECVHLHLFKWTCEKCSARFQTRGGLKHHRERTHEGKIMAKTHMCETCGRGFAYKTTLKNHILTHTGEQPHVCDICDRPFRQKTALKTHVELVHLKLKKPYKNKKRNPDMPPMPPVIVPSDRQSSSLMENNVVAPAIDYHPMNHKSSLGIIDAFYRR